MCFFAVYGISCVTYKGNFMKVSCNFLFEGLRVNTKYYNGLFKKIGVKNRFFFDLEDLEKISKIPTTRYKTGLVVERAKNVLEDLKNVKSY